MQPLGRLRAATRRKQPLRRVILPVIGSEQPGELGAAGREMPGRYRPCGPRVGRKCRERGMPGDRRANPVPAERHRRYQFILGRKCHSPDRHGRSDDGSAQKIGTRQHWDRRRRLDQYRSKSYAPKSVTALHPNERTYPAVSGRPTRNGPPLGRATARVLSSQHRKTGSPVVTTSLGTSPCGR